MSLWHRQCDIQKNGNLIQYYGNTIGFILGDSLQVDVIFKKEEVIQWAEKEKLQIIWQTGLFEKLADFNSNKQLILPMKQISCRIYQLLEECDPVLRFCSFDGLNRKGKQIELKNYHKVYDGLVSAKSLDEICEYFDQIQIGYEGRALMVSDIIEVQENETVMYYYIDKGCYRQLKPVND